MKDNLTSIEALKLLADQEKEWQLADENYRALKQVKVRELDFGAFVINVQYNPARIVSSSAKVDKASINERKCFLCPANLPSEQKGLSFSKNYQVLVNPFPIFPQHFTIPIFEHEPQLIYSRYGDMLDLAKTLDQFIIFYNGPKCGASAPDHAHFQAGNKGFLPIEKELKKQSKKYIIEKPGEQFFLLKDYLRTVFVIESQQKENSIRLFERLYQVLEIKPDESEPMMNILVWFESGLWTTCVFPREKHRPACYFEEGDANILLSPASVDMGGVFITPLEKDFKKITKVDIQNILNEVSLSDEKLHTIIAMLKDR